MTDEGIPPHDPLGEPAPPAAPPSEPAGPQAGVAADLGTRFLARLIDHILLGIVIFALIVPLVIGAMFADVGFGSMFTGGFDGGSLFAGIVGAAITIGYFALMEARTGQTVGKMLLGLRTVGPDGGNPTTEAAFKRNAWYALGIIPWIGGLAELALAIYIAVTISNSVTNTGWHDEFAGGTKVIKTK